jgi:hypothetical protein
VYQARTLQPGAIQLLKLLPGAGVIDLAGQYSKWDDTNKIQLAVTLPGTPSSMQMVSWASSVVPGQTNFDAAFAGTPTPWVTNFPGAGVAAETVVSIGGGAGTYSGSAPWSSLLVMPFINAANKVQIFSASNGGGAVAAGALSLPASMQSLAGPILAGSASAAPSMHLALATTDGRLFSASATQPLSGTAAVVWTTTELAKF